MLLSAILPTLLGVLMAVYWRVRKTYPGFGYWTFSNLCMGTAYILTALRGPLPAWIAIVLGNVLLLYSLLLVYEGIQRFLDKNPRSPLNYAVLAGYSLLQIFWTYLAPDINARIILLSGVGAFLQMQCGRALYRAEEPKLRPLARSAAWLFFIFAIFPLLRIPVVLLQARPVDILNDDLSAVVTFAYSLSITIWSAYFFFINSARLEIDLQQSQSKLMMIAESERRKIVQLNLLDEASRSLADSLDELVILQRTVRTIVKQFGYIEAAVSLLVSGDELEIAALDGSEDIGYRPGYRQKMGVGIIGQAALTRRVYLSGDVNNDPHYFSIGKRGGSALGVPMLNNGSLLGVLYVESTTPNAYDQDDVQVLETLASHAVTAIQKARLYARAQAQLRTITTLQTISQTILSSLEIDSIMQSVVQALKDSLNFTYVSIYLLDGDCLRLRAQAGYGEDRILHEIPAAAGVAGRCVQTRRIQFVREASKDPDFLRAASEVESEICVPLIKGEAVLGILNVEAAPGRPLNQDDVELVDALAGSVVIAIENARLHTELKLLAMTDGLTRLYNRRAFDQLLTYEIDRAARYNYPLSLLILDMDSFKLYNDRRGHPAGDERLREVAAMLHNGVRSPDIVARYGGEEFAMILPNTARQSALVLAERVRSAAEAAAPEKPAAGGPIAGYTFSIGIATYPEDGRTCAELLLAADQAEFRAKRCGKNRVCTAADSLT